MPTSLRSQRSKSEAAAPEHAVRRRAHPSTGFGSAGHFTATGLFFLRENSLPTAPFYGHLVFRGVELENDPPAEELKFILRRRFERGSAFTARLNEERPAVPRDGPFLGCFGAVIYADVFVQDFRTYGDRFAGGNIERFSVVDVDR